MKFPENDGFKPSCSVSHDQDQFLSKRPRTVLTSMVAREIFQVKATHGFASTHSASQRLASKYGVSPKAIRDIWIGRSWLEATYDLWSVEDRPTRRIIGRPKGKKDSKPRKTLLKQLSPTEGSNTSLSQVVSPLTRSEWYFEQNQNSFVNRQDIPRHDIFTESAHRFGARNQILPSLAQSYVSDCTYMKERTSATEKKLPSLSELLAGSTAFIASHHCALTQPFIPAFSASSSPRELPLPFGPYQPVADALALRGGFGGGALPPPCIEAQGHWLAGRRLHAAALQPAGPADWGL